MPAPIEDDWSDSDDDLTPGLETSILLGIPDGPIDSPTDITDAAVSRIGGLPVRFPPCNTYYLNATFLSI